MPERPRVDLVEPVADEDELLALIETPEAMEGYVLRAQGQDDAKRRAQRCITAVQEAARLAAGRGWLS